MSFLRNYSIMTSGNESPVVYHNWAALSTLSSLISRRVWVDMGIFTVYPNMYVLFVGMPGIKKSTAMDISLRMLQSLHDIPISPPSVTKEALTQMMAEEDSPCQKAFKVGEDLHHYTHLSLYCNEFATLLDAGGNAPGMIGFLTDVWDRDEFEVRTKNKGIDTIKGPYITMLGCLTTETMNNLASTRIISSGFSRRCIFVYSDDFGTPVPIPRITEEQKLARDACIKRAKEILELKGEFKLATTALVWWDRWYKENFKARAEEKNAIFQGYLQSKAGYVLKVAMLISLSESNDLNLEPEHLSAALQFLEDIEPDMMRVFEGAGRNELAPIAASIKTMILASKKPVTRKLIHKTFHKDADPKEMDNVLDHLVNTEDEVLCKALTIDETHTVKLYGTEAAFTELLTTDPRFAPQQHEKGKDDLPSVDLSKTP